jgi:1-acyl-sn-glycerol-3-phosphate acyltransferase
MITLSYKNLRALVRTLPVCPKPKAVGLENIPDNGPIIYVYNHITRRGEPIYFGLAAPTKPNIRFLAETIVASPEYFPQLHKEVENAIFPPKFQKKAQKRLWIKLWYGKFINIMTKYAIEQANRLKLIQVDLFEPNSEEDRLRKRKTNKKAYLECIKSLENDIPIAIAPSGGRTHKIDENPVYQTIVPTLASSLYQRGKTVKIVPSIVKETPMITKRTYWKYVAHRFFFYKAIKRFWKFIKNKSYEKPRLVVEFLPPLTFEKANPSKPEKVEFVKNLQHLIYSSLKEA